MKVRLVQQTKLHFQEGSSDKVYEVDLCEAGEGEFLVNFRYGRRGTRLQEGTKTPFPEPHDKALAIFNKLVDSKKAKGYQEVGSATDVPAAFDSANAPKVGGGSATMRKTVLAHINSIALGKPPKNWPVSRIIWRAGELGLEEALPQLLLLSGVDETTDYSLAWTLGRIGHEDAVPKLRELAKHKGDKVSRIARESLALCLRGPDRVRFFADLAQSLPQPIWECLRTNDDEGTKNAVAQVLEAEAVAPEFLDELYLLGHESRSAREAVFIAASQLPLKTPHFRTLRHIFKAARLRLDAEMFGLMAHRFETTDQNYSYGWGWTYDSSTGRGVNLRDIITKSSNDKYAFNDRTRNYLRRSVARTLKRAGEIGDAPTFITLSTGVLLNYDDAQDKKSPEEIVYSRYEFSNSSSIVTVRTHYDDYANSHALNFLLYENSDRYTFVRHKVRWVCQNGFSPGDPTPSDREEAHPELWDQAPDALMHLLRESRCERVDQFAAKVWRANPQFIKLVDADFILALLGKPFEAAQELGLDLARDTFDSSNPNRTLILALLGCDLVKAHGVGLSWLGEVPQILREDANFAAETSLIVHEDVHLGIRGLLTSALGLSDSFLGAYVPTIVAGLAELPDGDRSAQIARQNRETLTAIAPKQLGQISFEIVRDLIAHSIAEVQALGGQILVARPGPADEIPSDLFHALLTSDSEVVRKTGMELFGKLSDEALLERADVLTSFCISEKADVREMARPIVERLAKQHPKFGQDVVDRFYPMVLRQEETQGMHEDVYKLLEGPLRAHLHVIPDDSTFRMLECRYREGQLLGLLLLRQSIGLDQVRMSRIVSIANTETKEVREHIWAYLEKNPARVKADLGDAVRLLDSDWDDSRESAFEYFRNHLDESDWDPDTLVGVCDSVRGEVQDFGREMITKFFQETDGPTYLLKLSQHPTPELQLFATNYLERFACDNLERMEKLEWYFLAVLSQVNRGRVAKSRVLRFLQAEGEKCETAAKFIADILTRQSLTVAIQDKALVLRALLAIHKAWPNVSVPFERKPPAVRTPEALAG